MPQNVRKGSRPDSLDAVRLGEYLRLSLKSTPNCSMFIDRDGFVDCCSDKFVRLVGAESDQNIIGKHFCDIYCLFGDRDKLIAGAREAFAEIQKRRGPQEKQLELSFPAADNKRLYFVQSIPLFNETGEFVGAKVMYFDNMDLTIKAANQSARLLLDEAPIGCTMRDSCNRIIDCNAEILKIFGVSDKAEFIRRFTEFHPERQPDGSISSEKIDKVIQKCLVSGRERLEWLYTTASGAPLPAEAIFVRADWRGDYRYLVYCVDLRESRAKEERERLANARSLAMLEAMPIACVFFDGKSEAIDCNTEATRLFGVGSKEELLERFLSYTPELQPSGIVSVEARKNHIAMALEDGQYTCEWLYITSSGKDLPALVTIRRMEWNGAICFAAYIQDMREIRAKDVSVREAEEIPLAILDSVPFPAFVWDNELRLIDCNAEAISAFGFADKTELIRSRPDLPTGSRGELENLNNILNDAFNEGNARFTREFLTNDGKPFNAEAIFTRIPWRDGYRVAAYLRP